MTWVGANEQCSANKSTNAASNYVSRLNKIAHFEQSQIDLQQERVLVIVQPNWHHGVIGIVASRLVDRYGVPVFIGTYEDNTFVAQRGAFQNFMYLRL